jgi:hypothetical protein
LWSKLADERIRFVEIVENPPRWLDGGAPAALSRRSRAQPQRYQAAAFAGMSRESAYRLRERRDGALFAALWDRAVGGDVRDPAESHTDALTDGRLVRLLGMHLRRERGDFVAFGSAGRECSKADPTLPL